MMRRRCLQYNIYNYKINTRQRRVFLIDFAYTRASRKLPSGARKSFSIVPSRMNSKRSAKLHAFIFVASVRISILLAPSLSKAN